MVSSVLPLYVTLTIFSVTIGLYYTWFKTRRASRLPPGPPGLPIIGNLFDLPKGGEEWVKWAEMGRKYETDMIYLNVVGKCFVVINSFKPVNDLLEKRSLIYSERMHLTMIEDLMEWGWQFPFMGYSDAWRAHRRLFHQEFNVNSARRFHPQQLRAAHNLLENILDSPERLHAHLKHQAGALIMDITYGIDILPENDPYINTAIAATTSLNAASIPGAFLVDSFPLLKLIPSWVPGAGFQKVAKVWSRIADDTRNVPFRALKEAIASPAAGVAKPSFGLNCLQNVDTNRDVKLQEDIIANTAGTMFLGGSDTTVSALETFVLAMVKYPEVQAKAQAELDRVLGKNQLPSFDDEGDLPYLMAIVKETLRWQTVAPLAIPHVLSKDDEYRGFVFPAGTIIIPNSWAILHDEEVYPDPFTFKPERFLKDGKLDPSVQAPELAAFGYGRRICPGQHMARASVWITIGSVLSTFTINKAIDSNGNPIDPLIKYTSGLASNPEHFECKVTPRSKEAESLIRLSASRTL